MTESSIQYFHGTKLKGYKQEFTLAVDVPLKEHLRLDIWKLMGDNIQSITLKMGITDVHPKDQYSRKKGRQVSVSKMVNTEFYLDEITSWGPTKTITFNDGGDIYITFELKTTRDKLHLIQAHI